MKTFFLEVIGWSVIVFMLSLVSLIVFAGLAVIGLSTLCYAKIAAGIMVVAIGTGMFGLFFDWVKTNVA